jgi:hypothetical protein
VYLATGVLPTPRFARSPRRFELVGGAGGLAMIGVGVTVAITGRQS